jgi:hypothetical protein
MLLGPVLHIFQSVAEVFSVPLYVPELATAGVALLLLAVQRRPSAPRITAFALCGLLAGAEWYLLLPPTKLPAFTPRMAVGETFRPFSTSLADGSAFDQDSLRGAQYTALVFFRGRW